MNKEKGREIIYRLVRNCDVFVQNFRKSAQILLKLGIKPDRVWSIESLPQRDASKPLGPKIETLV